MLALNLRELAEIAIPPEEIECVVDEPTLPTRGQLCLQFREVGSPFMDDHHLAVDDGLARYGERAGNLGEALGPVESVAGTVSSKRRNDPVPRPRSGPVEIDGRAYEVVVAKIAINVVRASGREENLLPEILRGWFGEDAGLPARGERVRLKRVPSGFAMEPLKVSALQGLQVWGRYLREAER